ALGPGFRGRGARQGIAQAVGIARGARRGPREAPVVLTLGISHAGLRLDVVPKTLRLARARVGDSLGMHAAEFDGNARPDGAITAEGVAVAKPVAKHDAESQRKDAPPHTRLEEVGGQIFEFRS